jgi:uncharacterized membrane protein YfcA
MIKWLYIRIALLIAGGLLSLWTGPLSSHAEPPLDLKALIIIFIFGIVGPQFLLGIQSFNKWSAEIWLKPSWLINPFSLKQPAQIFHFGAWFCIISGSITSLLTWYKSPEYILDSFIALFFGFGLLVGIHVSRQLFKRKYEAV